MTRGVPTTAAPASPLAGFAWRAALRRVPFTVTLTLGVLGASIASGGLAHPISPEMLQRWGFELGDLRHGRFLGLISAPFLVLRPWMAASIVAILLGFVGSCEYLLGTRRASTAFVIGHLVGYLGGPSLLRLLSALGVGWAGPLTLLSDVGASNGAFGAAGVVLIFLPRRIVRIAHPGMILYLLVVLWFRHEVWDIAHLLAFLAGSGLGLLYAWQDGRERPRVLPRLRVVRRDRPRVVAWMMRGMGLVNVVTAFVLPHQPRLGALEGELPLGVPHGNRHLLFLSGLLLLVLAPALSRGRRSAWWGAFLAVAAGAVAHLIWNPSRGAAFLGILMLGILAAWRRQFAAPHDPLSARQGRRALAALALGLPLYTLLGFLALRSQFEPRPEFYSAWREAGARLFFSGADLLTARGHAAAWFLDSFPVLAWPWLLLGVLQLWGGARAVPATVSERERARGILETHGRSGTAAMTLWEGNALYFLPDGSSYVAYRVNAGIAVALGDPVGPVSRRRDAIGGFIAHAEREGWVPVFFAANEEAQDDHRAHGQRLLKIGEEAVLPLDQLEFKGKAWQNVRTAINRAEREGVSFRVYEGGAVPAPIRSQLEEISAAWEANQALPPMGFTLGRLDDVDDPTVVVTVAVDAQERVLAFTDWLPVPARRGWVIDQMRRRDDAMSTVMEFLIGVSLLTFKERGDKMASLATAPLANAHAAEDESLLQRALGVIFESGGGPYRFRSLFAFKERFRPHWEGTFLAYRGTANLPAISVALMRCYLPSLDAADLARLAGSAIAKRLAPGEGKGANTPRGEPPTA